MTQRNDSDVRIVAQRAIEAVSILIDRVNKLESEVKQLKALHEVKREQGCTVVSMFPDFKNTAIKK